ncbi:CAP domain-containing protein [Neobacillus sp. OS1-32]|uniref:CAP domain-containing protein n=1 Tax=Neobacillus paridis TaxID=2803862 RepID=A0ABS1THF7_9BACI|nr:MULTISPECIES: CAP domain-containing protein [Neobacillus]MBL4950746.1 CAP domain-containing protein [Neobacillus paridis]WML31276.1 CAP domain-containing protein [Neobacillus sp. OS1-32]
MKRFFVLLISIALLYFSWPAIEQKLGLTGDNHSIKEIQSEINSMKSDPKIIAAFNSLYDNVQQVVNQLALHLNKQPLGNQTEEQSPGEKINLKTPAEQLFSIHNIELGETKAKIEQQLGPANRSSANEYGTNWYAYHDHYRNFFMVMYDQNNKAAGLYTNQNLIASKKGIKLGTSKESVRKQLGEPLNRIQKGFMIYQLEKDRDYDVYLLNDVYITIFYDKHEGNTITAIQLITKDMEQGKTELYPKASANLKQGLEYQLFDLTNAARVEHGLSILNWDQHVQETARKHSTDMAVHHYFDHTNLKGQSPFDRMKEDHIIFYLAGENLAYGQFSSIFAHEGLMNSLGHRENILRKGYKYLGVGVAFNDQSQPYYTENFYAK